MAVAVHCRVGTLDRMASALAMILMVVVSLVYLAFSRWLKLERM